VSLAASARAEPRGRTATDRLFAAVPLLTLFFWVCVLYMWEAWRHGSPWLFGDELQMTQLSRAIADTGHPARRGQPYTPDTLYPYFTAPAWLIHNVRHAYSTAKYMDVVAMTSTTFWTYGLARFVVRRPAALFAAAGSVLIPTLAFSSMLVPETVAYPYAALNFFLIAGAFIRRTRWWIAGAIVASLLAPLVRRELLAVPAALVLAALFMLWHTPQAERWRARWDRRDWLGFVLLVVGGLILVSAVMGNQSHEWLVATRIYKHRMFKYGLWAAGAVVIELGVFPVVAGLASLWRSPGEIFRYEVRAFRSVLLAGVITFGWYTAVKASYLSTVFGTYVVERNLIYIIPLLLVGTALWLERRRVHPGGLVVAAVVVLYIVLTTPYGLLVGSHFYSQAPGAALIEWLNRTSVGLTPTGAKVLLVLVLLGSVAVLLASRYAPRAGLALALGVSAFVLGWGFTGAVTGASASNASSRDDLSNIHGNPTWLDDITHGAPALYLGQQIQDPNSDNLLEFWNRSLKDVWSLDGTAPGPGPGLTPDVHGIHGVLYPDPHVPYVVAEPGIDVVGSIVATHPHKAGGGFQLWTLYRVSEPLRLRYAVTGRFADGWSGPNDTAYTRYSTPGDRAGTMRVLVSWREWPGPNSAKVTVLMGTLVIGPDKEPAIGKVTAVRTWRIHAKQTKIFTLRAPRPEFRVEVHVSPKFMPAQLISGLSDRRELGAQVQYNFIAPQRKHR
jgi:hypothetical protein